MVKYVMSMLCSLTAGEYPAITPVPNPLITPWIIILPTEIKLCCKTLGIATTAKDFRIWRENSDRFSLVSIFFSLRNTNAIASTQLIH